MDLIVRTPHGDAEVTLGAHRRDTTIGDLVGLVTGQAVPPLAAIDGRPVSTDTLLGDAELLIGSIVSTGAESASSVGGPAVNLVQVTGYGAGSIRRLAPGRFHVGPGRRVTADELSDAPVGTAAFELHVDDRLGVTVLPAEGNAPELDDTLVRSPTRWTSGLLHAGGRMFAIESPAPEIRPRSLARPDPDGTIPFNRPPLGHGSSRRHVVVDALRDAAGPRDALWRRRLSDPDALALQFGLDGATLESLSLNLAREMGAAIVGSARFRYALARTLLVEACTLHGPADVDVVVATRPESLANWDWAKWLPHVRVRPQPSLLSTDADFAGWLHQRTDRTPGIVQSHLTVVVVDAPELWMRRESPMRSTLLEPPADLRVIALCESSQMAPAICSSTIEATTAGFARFESRAADAQYPDVRPALTEVNTATQLARYLAPLDDNDQPARDRRQPEPEADHVELRPAAYGRTLTPLERRLTRTGDRVT